MKQTRVTIIDVIFRDENGILDTYWNNRRLLGIKKKGVVYTISSYGLKIRHNTSENLKCMISNTSCPEVYHCYYIHGYRISYIVANSRVFLLPSTWKYYLYVDAILYINDNTYQAQCRYNNSSPGYIWLYINKTMSNFRSESYKLVPYRTDHTIVGPLLFYGSNVSCLPYDSYEKVMGLQYPIKSIFLSYTDSLCDMDILYTCDRYI